MKEQIDHRFQQLIQVGDTLIQLLPREGSGYSFWVPEVRLPDFQNWLGSCANLLRTITPAAGHYAEECQHLMSHESMERGIAAVVVLKMLGLVRSAHVEWQSGLLRRIEYIVAAETFDDFLDHAAMYHKGNKKIEAAVLASAVLEDALKRITKRHDIDPAGKSMEEIVDTLTKAAILTPVKAKRVRSIAAVRNHAMHAEWDSIDIRDVGELVRGTKALIEELL
jgi:uncharacterized protein YutE (UPF0331/DUF86 family)